MSVGVVILAAGFGRRFRAKKEGHDKRLHALGTSTLANSTVAVYRQVFSCVRVVVRHDDSELVSSLKDFDIEFCIATDADKGMGHSISAGFQNLSWHYAFVALLDMPFIQASTLETLRQQAQKCPDQFIKPYYSGPEYTKFETFGHPIGIPSQYFSEVANSTGDKGAKRLLRKYANRVMAVDFDDIGIIQDIDVPADLPKKNR